MRGRGRGRDEREREMTTGCEREGERATEQPEARRTRAAVPHAFRQLQEQTTASLQEEWLGEEPRMERGARPLAPALQALRAPQMYIRSKHQGGGPRLHYRLLTLCPAPTGRRKPTSCSSACRPWSARNQRCRPKWRRPRRHCIRLRSSQHEHSRCVHAFAALASQLRGTEDSTRRSGREEEIRGRKRIL